MSRERAGGIILVSLVVVISTCMMLYHLSAQAFQDDEALYAEVTTEILTSHEFLSFTYRGENYFNKPPLGIWLMTLSREFIPSAEEATRLPSAVAGILLVGVVMLLVFDVTRNLYAAALGGAILATTASFEILTRAARFDSLVSLWVTLAIYSFLKSFENRKWFIIFGVCMGLAVLTKGPLVFFAFVAACAAAVAYRTFDWIRDTYFWSGIGIALILIVPWHVYETLRFGMQFWNVYVIGQVVERVQDNLLGSSFSNGEYVVYLLKYAAPWSWVFLVSVGSLPFFWKKLSQKTRVYLTALLTEIATVLLVCMVTESKAYRYVLPLYPCAAAFIAIVLYEIPVLDMHYIRRLILTGLIVLVSISACWAEYVGLSLDQTYPYYTNNPMFLAEEKTIGAILTTQKATNFYVYDTVRIRPIIFYSQRIHPYNMPIGPFSGVLYVTMPTASLSTFQSLYPSISTTMVYQGNYMDLLVVKPAYSRPVSFPQVPVN